MNPHKATWRQLPPWQRALLLSVGALQLGSLAAAWLDLSWRHPAQLRGSKATWRVALLISGVGPLAYWLAAHKRGRWTAEDMPDMSGKVAVITGANSGLGFETAKALAQRGASVVLACRSRAKAEQAAGKLLALCPASQLSIMLLDLSDLDSVRRFAAELKAKYPQIDLLINNAGVMLAPYGTTQQGFETQLGVNYLGHFALTAEVLPLLSPHARIVNLSSTAHRFGKIRFDDLQWIRLEYNPMAAYGQSKLAILLFSYELQRRLTAAGSSIVAVAAHPGYSDTQGQDFASSNHLSFNRLMTTLFAQSAQQGAWPTLYAATAPEVKGGQYFGPSGFGELGGSAQQVDSSAASKQREVAQRLWGVAEQLTGRLFVIDN